MNELQDYRKHLFQGYLSIVEALRDRIQAIPPERLHVPLPNGKTPHQVISALRSIEVQVFASRMRLMLENECPHFSAFDLEAWMIDHYDPFEPVEKILDEYDRIRKEELAFLQPLTPDKYNRTSHHSLFGVRTLQWWMEYSLKYAAGQLRAVALDV